MTRRLRSPQFLVAVAVLALAAISMQSAVRFMDIHLRKLPIHPASELQFTSIPTEVPGWRRFGPEQPALSTEVLDELGTRNYISRLYVRTDAPEGEKAPILDLHCAYYTGMIDTVPHVPERCFVGGGMSIDGVAGQLVSIPLDLERFPPAPFIDAERFGVIRRGRTGPTSDTPGVFVRMPAGLEDLQMNVTRFSGDDGAAVYAGYFFIANGGLAGRAEEIRRLAFRPEDRFAYYAKVQITSADANSPEELAELAADFLNEMLPEIVRRTPDWVSVIEGEHPAAATAQDADA